MKKKLIILFTILITITTVTASLLYAEEEKQKEEIVFTGIPKIKISEAGIDRVIDKLSGAKAIEFKCTITKIEDKYYWTTRENVEMVPVKSGAFITFVAINGAGYVRIINPDFKKATSFMGETEEKFDYIEHLLIQLKTITYYGNSS